MHKVLRVALVWHGTVLQENLLRDKGRVVIGGRERGSVTLHVPSSDVDVESDATQVLVDGGSGSFNLHVPRDASGKIVVGGDEKDASAVAGQTVTLTDGDWGVLTFGETSIFFQWVDDDVLISGAGFFQNVDWNLAAAVFFALMAHVIFRLVAELWPQDEGQLSAIEIPDRFVQILVDEPPDVVEEVEEEDQIDESMSKKAGGEEGKFGKEDAEVEDSVLPDHDGPMVQELETPELGRAFDAAIGQTGALSNVFGSSDMMANTFGQDFATAGEGDAFVLGRGAGGLGMRGGGSGGGGEGFGRAHGVGEIDTGGGRGQGASLGRRGQRAPRARVSRGRPNVNGFLSREQIERVVRRHARGIRFCYERELQNDPELGGRISINWTIGLDGRVQSASVAENTMGNRNVESCILREVRRMRFDQPDGGMVVVTYPFTFRGVTD